MATPVPLVPSSLGRFGASSIFARRADPLMALLGTLAGAAAGQTLLPVVTKQQQLLVTSVRLGPAAQAQAPTALAQFRESSAALSGDATALASVANTIAQASIPAENDLLAARQVTARVVRTYNNAHAVATNAPLVLKSEVKDSLKATVTALQSSLSSIGITINADGTLSLNESTLATALDLGSSTVTTAATTLRELGGRLGALGKQFNDAPAEQLLYQPPLNPTAERASGKPEPPPPITLSGAGVVYAYLFAKQRMEMLTALRSLETSGTLFSALV